MSDSVLRKRLEAVKGVEGGSGLVLEFYDRNRIATWVRCHPGLIPWVRQKIGRSLQGWQPYGAWAYPSEDETAGYLLDDKLRIHRGSKEGGKGASAANGTCHAARAARVGMGIISKFRAHQEIETEGGFWPLAVLVLLRPVMALNVSSLRRHSSVSISSSKVTRSSSFIRKRSPCTRPRAPMRS